MTYESFMKILDLRGSKNTSLLCKRATYCLKLLRGELGDVKLKKIKTRPNGDWHNQAYHYTIGSDFIVIIPILLFDEFTTITHESGNFQIIWELIDQAIVNYKIKTLNKVLRHHNGL